MQLRWLKMLISSRFSDDIEKEVSALLNQLDPKEASELLKYIEIVTEFEKYNKFNNMYPDTGDYRRELYPKHVDLMNASTGYREICMLGGNRTGKTELGAYLTTCHATGVYPEWYTGKRFKHPPKIWVGGDTATTCRDIIQDKLLGRVGDHGSGMIPKEKIKEVRNRRNVPDAVETIRVNHVSGGVSEIVLKTYEQGRETWQGTEVDFIWIDEECPADVYSEAVMRTMTTGGYIFLTFTPLRGLTDVVLMFMNNSQETDGDGVKKYLKYITWDDCGHLSDQVKKELLGALPPHEREARSKGIPTIGSGKIYPVPESEFVIEPIQIPRHFPRAFGMDVGWNATACIWGALDRDTDTIYIYDEYKVGEKEPAIHASAIRSRGEWIPGVIDPAARGRNQHDGTKLFEKYLRENLKITPADNAREAGIYEVWQRLSTSRIKIFSTCTNTISEMRLYRRDEKGNIVKKDDHLMDCLRYLCMSGIKRANVMVDSLRTIRDNKVVPIRALAWS